MDTNKSVREIDGHKFPGYRLHLTPVRHQRSPSNKNEDCARSCLIWFFEEHKELPHFLWHPLAQQNGMVMKPSSAATEETERPNPLVSICM